MTGTEGSDATRGIPATAEAIVDLLNSRPHGTAPALPEALHTPQAASVILRPFGQPDTMVAPPERIAEVCALREILMDMVVAAPDSADAGLGWAKLTEHASSVALRQTFSAPGMVQLQQVDGDPVVGGITLAVAKLMTDGTWSRLRACANDLCTHVFYDTTRSRTQRWHSYEMCGNRSNVAAYRARKKSRQG